MRAARSAGAGRHSSVPGPYPGVVASYGGTLIRMARAKAGIDIEELAARLGCTTATVQRWEQGRAPALDDVLEALLACGFELRMHPCDDQPFRPRPADDSPQDARARIDDMLRRRAEGQR